MRNGERVTVEKIQSVYRERKAEIGQRIEDFETVWRLADDARLFEEMVYCFFTGGCSARMGIRSVEAVRELLADGSQTELAKALTGVHRYPNARSRYVIASRDFLRQDCEMRLRQRLLSFGDVHSLRDWLVTEKGIKGLGYKEASHYLRNVGFKGLAILDKHVLRCLADLGIIDDPKPPNSRSRYLSVELSLKSLAERLTIDFDELDLVLWSLKTGEILK